MKSVMNIFLGVLEYALGKLKSVYSGNTLGDKNAVIKSNDFLSCSEFDSGRIRNLVSFRAITFFNYRVIF